MGKRILLLLAVLGLLTSACAGSSKSGKATGAAKGEITATFSNIAETPTLDVPSSLVTTNAGRTCMVPMRMVTRPA